MAQYELFEEEVPTKKGSEGKRIAAGFGTALAEGVTTPLFAAPLKGLEKLFSSLTGHKYATAEHVAAEPVWSPRQLFSPETQQYLKPQGYWETLGQEALSRAPATAGLAALFGPAGIPAALGGATAGAAAKTGLEHLGITTPYLTVPADIAADLGVSSVITGLQKGLPVTPGQARSAAQKEIAPLTRAGEVAITPIEASMNEIDQLLLKMGDKPGRDVLEDMQRIVNTASQGGKADLRDVYLMRERLDAMYPQIEKQKLGKYGKQLRDSINTTLRSEEAKLVNPRFWNALATNDQLSVINYAQDSIGKLAKRFEPKLIDILISPKYVAGPKSLVWGVLKGASGINFLQKYMRSPAFRKIYMDLGRSVSKSEYIRNAFKVANYLKENEAPKEAEPNRYEVFEEA